MNSFIKTDMGALSSIIRIANPSQSHQEIIGMLYAIEVFNKTPVWNLLEVGTYLGGSLKIWIEVFNPDIAIGIDDTVREGQEAKGGEILIGNSHTQEMFDQIKEKFQGQGVDFLFIDGDHLYDGVKQDFEMYSQLVSPGAPIGFHDTHLVGNEHCEVKKFWDEIKDNYKHVEIWGGGEHDTGCGVLWLPE